MPLGVHRSGVRPWSYLLLVRAFDEAVSQGEWQALGDEMLAARAGVSRASFVRLFHSVEEHTRLRIRTSLWSVKPHLQLLFYQGGTWRFSGPELERALAAQCGLQAFMRKLIAGGGSSLIQEELERFILEELWFIRYLTDADEDEFRRYARVLSKRVTARMQ